MIIDPASEDRSLHRHCPGLWKGLDPDVQFPEGRTDLPFLADATARVLDAIADGLLVHIESDVIHMSFEEPPWLWSESTWPLSSALCTPRAPLGLSIQTVSRFVSLSGASVATTARSPLPEGQAVALFVQTDIGEEFSNVDRRRVQG